MGDETGDANWSTSQFSNNSSWETLHEGVTPPASFLLARDVAWATISITGLFFLSAFIVMLARFRELRTQEAAQGSRNATKIAFQKKVVGWMLVNTGFNVMQQIENSVMFGVDAAARSPAYCHFSQKHGAFTFMGAMWGNYMVLAIRARTTSAGASKMHQMLQWSTELMALTGLPGIMILSLVLFRGRVLFDSVCTQELPTIVTYIFMVADLNLSVMLLALFVLPVMKHLKSVSATAYQSSGTEGNNKASLEMAKLRRTAVKNMKLSVVQVVSTFFVQVIGNISQTILSDEHDPELSYWRWVRFALYGVDLILNTVTLMMMSNAWVPESWPRLRALLSRYLDEDKGNNSNNYSTGRGGRSSTKVQHDGSSQAPTMATSSQAEDPSRAPRPKASPKASPEVASIASTAPMSSAQASSFVPTEPVSSATAQG